jgi:hypothetical protein
VEYTAFRMPKEIYSVIMSELSWDLIEKKIERIVSDAQQQFDPNTIANARDLVEICRTTTPIPNSVAKGYWNTISLSWPKFEIEVFEDRLEVYHFNDRSTDIWYETHEPSGPFSEKFLDELRRLATLPRRE